MLSLTPCKGTALASRISQSHRHIAFLLTMRLLFRLTITIWAFAFSIPALSAQSPSFVPPAGSPLAMLVLPDGLKANDVSLAVSKALVVDEWENLGWEGSVTTATTKQSKINIKVFALAGAAEVKFFAEYTTENNIPEDKRRQVVLRALRSLEKVIAEKLGLAFHKAKGDETVDRAVGE